MTNPEDQEDYELHMADVERDEAAAKCPKCKSSSQVWENQITGEVKCHRYGCEEAAHTLPNKIKRLADLLGWNKGPYWIISGASVCAPHEYPSDTSSIIFAAYVKAEMAKRERCHVIIAPVIECPGEIMAHTCMRAKTLPNADEVTDVDCPYDPTDPLSEAEAIIDCAIEALEGENESELKQ